MTDMPKEIMAGDSFGYNMWTCYPENPDNHIFIDKETRYIRADLYDKQTEAIKILQGTLEIAFHKFDDPNFKRICDEALAEAEQALEQTKEIE